MRARGATAVLLALAGGGLAVATPACAKQESKPASPAKVAGARPESELATITLTPEAEARLGIEQAKVERQRVPHVREVGGEVVAPPGRALPITAPLAGTLLPPADGRVPAAGERVERGQTLFRLAPLPPADLELQRDRAREELATAEARLEAAFAAADRAHKLKEVGAGSQKAEDDAKAQLTQAEAARKSAQSRLEFLSATDLNAAARASSAIRLEAPRAGVLMDVNVAPGSTVVAGATLGQLVADDVLWVRVPLYAGAVAAADKSGPATVTKLGEAGTSWSASPVTAPPRADALAATADLTYALPEGTRGVRPGERVRVALPLAGGEDALVVPWSAILYDIDGGTWVYTVPAPHVYARKRVQVRYLLRPLAVLGRGPEPGTSVVSAGAAELFGAEFGAK